VSEVILDGAARVFSRQGADANMTDIAVEAGVARATVYRHFPSRQALLDRLVDRAAREAGDRLQAARIVEVPLREAVVRSIRALVDVGDYVTVLARAWGTTDGDQLDEAVAGPLHRMVERGQADGTLRGDVPASWLADSLVGMILAVLASPTKQGREDTVDTIAGLFLEGAALRDDSQAMEAR